MGEIKKGEVQVTPQNFLGLLGAQRGDAGAPPAGSPPGAARGRQPRGDAARSVPPGLRGGDVKGAGRQAVVVGREKAL